MLKMTVALLEADGEIALPVPDEILAASGFYAGMTVDVTAQNGRMVIQQIPDSPDTPVTADGE